MLQTGTVIEVNRHRRGPRYRLNTREYYGSGKPVEPVVTYLWHDESYDPDATPEPGDTLLT